MKEHENVSSDSSLLLKITFSNATVLAGRPISIVDGTSTCSNTPSAVVVQMSCNSLFMFQSVENADGSGMRTVHLSIDDFSGSVLNVFHPISPKDVPLIFGPIAAELRAVSNTENLGIIVTQDFSFDCESVRSCVSSDDLKIVQNIYRKMYEKLEKGYHVRANFEDPAPAMPFLFIKQKGTGVATNIRLELQRASFVLMNTLKKNQPFLDVSVSPIKCNLEGCASAMSGECNVMFSLNFFNTSFKCDWESVIEPWHIVLALEQMPDEIVCNIASADDIHVNVTNDFLCHVSEIFEDYLSFKPHENSDDLSLSVFGSLAERKGSNTFPILLRNECGIDIILCPSSDINFYEPDLSRDLSSLPRSFLLSNSCQVDLRNHFEEFQQRYFTDIGEFNESPTLTLALSSFSSSIIRDRLFITGLPIVSSEGFKFLHKLKSINDDEEHNDRIFEPVVEWCMQNQRLRVNVSDVYSMRKGEDLLSSVSCSYLYVIIIFC